MSVNPLPHPDDSPSPSNLPGAQVIYVAAPGRQTALWVIAVLLAVIATALVARLDESWLSSRAMAQVPGPSAAGLGNTRGIYAFTGQLGAKDYGLFMMDVDTATVWCYEMARGRDGELQLQLVAARSWIFDRYLEEFNVAKPTPAEVQVMVRQQRSNAAAGGAAGTGIGVGAATPPVMPTTQQGAGAGSPPGPALPSDDGK